MIRARALRRSRGVAGAAAVCALAVVVAPAHAALVGTLATAVGHVAVLVPNVDDPVIAEASSRLRSELRVVGVDSSLIGCDGAGALDARACSATHRPVNEAELSSPPPAAGPRVGVAGAVIALAREDGVVTIEVIERLVNGSRFFRLVFVPAHDGGDDPAVLAVRGVELLRDLHMDVERSEDAPRLPTSPAVVAPTAPSLASPGPWRIIATAGLLQGRNGLGPRVAPALGLARAFGLHLAATVFASGPFLQELSTATSQGDHTSTDQELALVGVRGMLGTRAVRPYGTLSAGVLHLAARGHVADSSAASYQPSLWSALAGAGVGVAYALGRFIDLVAQADLLLAAPAGQVTIRSTVVGTAGAPSALFQLGLWAALP